MLKNLETAPLYNLIMRTLPINDREEINNILKACKTCWVAMSDENIPYVLPMNFAQDGDYIILHSAQHGRMWETLKKNPQVCINWTLGEEITWQDVRVGCSYRVKSKSVIVEGRAEFIDDFENRIALQHVGVFFQIPVQHSRKDKIGLIFLNQ